MCNKKKIVFLLFSSSIVPLVFFLGNVFAHGKWCLSRIYRELENAQTFFASKIGNTHKYFES